MAVQINFVNGGSISVNEHTRIFAWRSDDNSDGQGFYATSIFGGSSYDSPEIDTTDPRVGLQGLLGIADWFTIDNPDNELYKTSAILSIS